MTPDEAEVIIDEALATGRRVTVPDGWIRALEPAAGEPHLIIAVPDQEQASELVDAAAQRFGASALLESTDIPNIYVSADGDANRDWERYTILDDEDEVIARWNWFDPGYVGDLEYDDADALKRVLQWRCQRPGVTEPVEVRRGGPMARWEWENDEPFPHADGIGWYPFLGTLDLMGDGGIVHDSVVIYQDHAVAADELEAWINAEIETITEYTAQQYGADDEVAIHTAIVDGLDQWTPDIDEYGPVAEQQFFVWRSAPSFTFPDGIDDELVDALVTEGIGPELCRQHTAETNPKARAEIKRKLMR